MRLIDADDMKTDVINQMAFISLFGDEFAELAEIVKDGIVKEIEKAPTIDAVPVVRCKDCKHHHDSFGEEYCHRSYTPMPVSAEWFCPKGERKDDEEQV